MTSKAQYDYPQNVEVFCAEQYDGEGWMPVKLLDAFEWLRRMIEAVPEAYRDSARIEIDSVLSWEDSHYARIAIEYSRPPTPEEIAQRKAEARDRAEQSLAAHRERAAAEEARLRALLEDPE